METILRTFLAKSLLAAGVAFLTASAGLHAQTVTSGFWTDPATWTSGNVPTATSTNVYVRHNVGLNTNLTISSGTYYFGWSGSSVTNTTATDLPGGDAYTLTVQKAGGYSATQCILDIRSGTTTFEGAAVLDNANVIIRSGATLIVGPLSIANNSRLTVEEGGTLIVNGDVVDNNNGSGTTVVHGYVRILGNYTTSVGSVEITGSGSFETTGSIITSGSSTVFGSRNDCTTGPCSGASLACGSGGESYVNVINPSTQQICASQSPAALVATTNAPTPTYQWQVSTTSGGTAFTNISGATSSSFSPGALTQNSWYRVVVKTGSCTSTSPSSAIIVQNGAVPTPAEAGSDQAVCFGSATQLAANAPSVGNGSWSIINGPNTSTAQLSAAAAPDATFTPSAAGAYTLRWTIANSCATSSSDVVITAAIANTLTWTGGAYDQHWSNPQNWDCPQIPAHSQNVIIPDGSIVIVDFPSQARNVTVQSGATLMLSPGQSLNLTGDITNNGTFTGAAGSTFTVTGNIVNNGIWNANEGTIRLAGSVPQTIHANNGMWHTLEINKSGGAVSLSSPLRISHLLSIESETVVQSNGHLTILSRGITTDLDGAIGPILHGGSISGNVRVERFMDAIGSTFRYIASPVKNISRPAALPNIYRYAPTGWVKYAGNLTTGEGYATQTASKQITWNASGEIHIGDRTWTFPAEGWYLIGNPYPSAIQWNNDPSAWTIDRDKVSTTIAVTDNSIAGYPNYFRYYQYDSADPESWGSGPMVNGVVAMGQSFWVYSLAGGSITIHEQAKASAGGEFYRTKAGKALDQLVIRLDNGQTSDQTFLSVSKGASPRFDLTHDLPKLWNMEMNIYLLDETNREMLRHGIGSIPEETKIGVGLQVTTPGAYTISFEQAEQFSYGASLYLVDRYEGVKIPVAAGEKYQFNVKQTSTAIRDRFYLAIEPREIVRAERLLSVYPNPFTEQVTLRAADDGTASADVFDHQGKLLFSHNWSGESTVDMRNMEKGLYVFRIKTGNNVEVRKVVKE